MRTAEQLRAEAAEDLQAAGRYLDTPETKESFALQFSAIVAAVDAKVKLAAADVIDAVTAETSRNRQVRANLARIAERNNKIREAAINGDWDGIATAARG